MSQNSENTAANQSQESAVRSGQSALRECDPPPEDVFESFSETVRIPIGKIQLTGDWVMPDHAVGIVLFAHGSGSSRHSLRNKAVARVLQNQHIGTLLLDLLTPEEERIDAVTTHLRFDIDLLARRLVETTRWLRGRPAAASLPLGYFGASTGAGAALVAAAEPGNDIQAVVSRGGRPDLAESSLQRVVSPTLLIVGGNDQVVEELNKRALAQLHCMKKQVIVPGATHLFEEPGTMEQVAELATNWFLMNFTRNVSTSRS